MLMPILISAECPKIGRMDRLLSVLLIQNLSKGLRTDKSILSSSRIMTTCSSTKSHKMWDRSKMCLSWCQMAAPRCRHTLLRPWVVNHQGTGKARVRNRGGRFQGQTPIGGSRKPWPRPPSLVTASSHLLRFANIWTWAIMRSLYASKAPTRCTTNHQWVPYLHDLAMGRRHSLSTFTSAVVWIRAIALAIAVLV